MTIKTIIILSIAVKYRYLTVIINKTSKTWHFITNIRNKFLIMVVKIKKSFRKFQDRIRSTPLMAIFSQIQHNSLNIFITRYTEIQKIQSKMA